MKDKLPLDKAMKILEDSFLLWDEKTIKSFILTVMKGWGSRKDKVKFMDKKLNHRGGSI